MNNLINDTTFATKNNLVGLIKQFAASYILAGIGNYCLTLYSLFQQLKENQAQTISHFPVPLLKTVSDLDMKEDMPKLMFISSAPPASLLQKQEDIDLEKAIEASLEDARPSALEDVAVRMAIQASLEYAQPKPSAPPASLLQEQDIDLEKAIQASLKDLKEIWIDDFHVYFKHELQKYGKQNIEHLENMQKVMANLQREELEANLLHYQEVIKYYENTEAIENIHEVEAKSLMHAIYAKEIIEKELHMKE